MSPLGLYNIKRDSRFTQSLSLGFLLPLRKHCTGAPVPNGGGRTSTAAVFKKGSTSIIHKMLRTNLGVYKMGKLSSHHSRIFRVGPDANANAREQSKPCKAKTTQSKAMFSELQPIGVKSPAHSIDIHIAPVLKTRTVQQAASLFVGRFVGECIRLRSTRKEEPKKSTVGFSG